MLIVHLVVLYLMWCVVWIRFDRMVLWVGVFLSMKCWTCLIIKSVGGNCVYWVGSVFRVIVYGLRLVFWGNIVRRARSVF